MPPTETTAARCAGCAAAIPRDAPFGQCPRCVLALGRGILLVQEPDGELLNAGQVRSFGDYELLEEIARGGMGVVYRARQLSLGREVAVKMILAGALATTESVQRFRNEAAAAARLDHPHIVAVYEIGEHETQHYFSMRLVLGRQNIAIWAKALALSPEARTARIAAIMVKVARAVAFAHEHGVLHRDLKPSNILVDEKGEPSVVDFGIARHLDADPDLTLTGQTIGTPRYIAPEQARGENRTLTPAADTYSLGAILYELLAGRKIFDGPDMLTLLKQVAEQPPAPLRLADRDLENIVLHCLEKSPVARYGSAADFADDLERWLRHEPVTARPVGLGARLAKWARRRPAHATLAGLAVAGAVVLATLLMRGTAKNAKDATRASHPATPAVSISKTDIADPVAARRVLEWLHSAHGDWGFLDLRRAGEKPFRHRPATPLPPGDFTITQMQFARSPSQQKAPPISSADFRQHTATLHQLTNCFLFDLDLTADDLAFLTHNPDLEELHIRSLRVGDRLIPRLAGLKKLRYLHLSHSAGKGDEMTGHNLGLLSSLHLYRIADFMHTSFDDVGAAILAERCPKLLWVWLEGTHITNAALRSLSRRALDDLKIGGNSALTDAGLAELAKIPALKKLNIKGSNNFTDAGVAAFQKAHPECKIER